jgi:uncharacterized repeat protein (TIGR03837 family)
MQSRRWDIFCKVIDNHGDLGVCWRLACQLAVRGERVRLWIDDASALRWMAPAGHEGVEVIDWLDAAALRAAVAAPVPDVLVEGFGCEPAPELVARFAEGPGRAWVNLEYLSAEPYVERLHGLPSPVFKGPGAGLTKRFFYPGFTVATGGLLREPDLMERRARFDRAPWLAAQQIAWTGAGRLVSLFCYEPPALAELLAQLAHGPEPTHLLVTAGRAAQAVQALLPDSSPAASAPAVRGALSISYLPYLTQPDYDHLLWSCDLNFVRGKIRGCAQYGPARRSCGRSTRRTTTRTTSSSTPGSTGSALRRPCGLSTTHGTVSATPLFHRCKCPTGGRKGWNTPAPDCWRKTISSRNCRIRPPKKAKIAGFADFGPDLYDPRCSPLNLPRDMYRGATTPAHAAEGPVHRAANIQRP